MRCPGARCPGLNCTPYGMGDKAGVKLPEDMEIGAAECLFLSINHPFLPRCRTASFFPLDAHELCANTTDFTSALDLARTLPKLFCREAALRWRFFNHPAGPADISPACYSTPPTFGPSFDSADMQPLHPHCTSPFRSGCIMPMQWPRSRNQIPVRTLLVPSC